MTVNKRFFLATSLCLSFIATPLGLTFADDEIHEPPTFGAVIDTQTTTQTVAPASPPPAANSSSSAASETSSAAATPQNNTQSRQMVTTYTLGQTQCSAQTKAMVLGVVGGSNNQRAEVVCVPNEGYESTPHFLANYALNKLGGGFGMRGVDHIQVMVIKKVYVADMTEKEAKGEKKVRRHESSPVPTETLTKAIYKQDVYRYTTDWPWIVGFIAHRGSNKLLAATNDGNIQGLYVTVDGVSDSSLFGMFNQAVTSLGPNAGTLGLAAVGLVQAGKLP